MAKQKKKAVTQLGKQPPRYRFFLNPYEDMRFTRCPLNCCPTYQIDGTSQEGKTGGEVTQLRCLPGDLDSSDLVSNTHEMCQCLTVFWERKLCSILLSFCQINVTITMLPVLETAF
jgi:hypothetical protein